MNLVERLPHIVLLLAALIIATPGVAADDHNQFSDVADVIQDLIVGMAEILDLSSIDNNETVARGFIFLFLFLVFFIAGQKAFKPFVGDDSSYGEDSGKERVWAAVASFLLTSITVVMTPAKVLTGVAGQFTAALFLLIYLFFFGYIVYTLYKVLPDAWLDNPENPTSGEQGWISLARALGALLALPFAQFVVQSFGEFASMDSGMGFVGVVLEDVGAYASAVFGVIAIVELIRAIYNGFSGVGQSLGSLSTSSGYGGSSPSNPASRKRRSQNNMAMSEGGDTPDDPERARNAMQGSTSDSEQIQEDEETIDELLQGGRQDFQELQGQPLQSCQEAVNALYQGVEDSELSDEQEQKLVDHLRTVTEPSEDGPILALLKDEKDKAEQAKAYLEDTDERLKHELYGHKGIADDLKRLEDTIASFQTYTDDRVEASTYREAVSNILEELQNIASRTDFDGRLSPSKDVSAALRDLSEVTIDLNTWLDWADSGEALSQNTLDILDEAVEEATNQGVELSKALEAVQELHQTEWKDELRGLQERLSLRVQNKKNLRDDVQATLQTLDTWLDQNPVERCEAKLKEIGSALDSFEGLISVRDRLNWLETVKQHLDELESQRATLQESYVDVLKKLELLENDIQGYPG